MTKEPRLRRPTLADIERDPDFRAAKAVFSMSKEEVAAALAREEEADPYLDERTCWDRIRPERGRRS